MKYLLVLMLLAGCTSPVSVQPPQAIASIYGPVLMVNCGIYSHYGIIRNNSLGNFTYYLNDSSFSLCSGDTISILWYFRSITIDRIDRFVITKDTSFCYQDTSHQFDHINFGERTFIGE